MTEQTSASERIEAARKALYAFDGAVNSIADATDMDEHEQGQARAERAALDCVAVLRALITPPSVGESEHEAAMEIARHYYPEARGTAYEAAARGIRAGIQSAHESWEPEVALQPSQEQMLRWLGIKFNQAPDMRGDIFIQAQMIDREEI